MAMFSADFAGKKELGVDPSEMQTTFLVSPSL